MSTCFENIAIGLHVLYVLNKHIKFCVNQWRFQEFFLGWSLKNLNYTKFNKVITSIFATIASQVAKEGKIGATAKPKKV